MVNNEKADIETQLNKMLEQAYRNFGIYWAEDCFACIVSIYFGGFCENDFHSEEVKLGSAMLQGTFRKACCLRARGLVSAGCGADVSANGALRGN
jgi:hypothetical protein